MPKLPATSRIRNPNAEKTWHDPAAPVKTPAIGCGREHAAIQSAYGAKRDRRSSYENTRGQRPKILDEDVGTGGRPGCPAALATSCATDHRQRRAAANRRHPLLQAVSNKKLRSGLRQQQKNSRPGSPRQPPRLRNCAVQWSRSPAVRRKPPAPPRKRSRLPPTRQQHLCRRGIGPRAHVAEPTRSNSLLSRDIQPDRNLGRQHQA